MTDTDGRASARRSGSTSHFHPGRVGPPVVALPNVSSCTCHRQASQSAERSATGAGTNAKRSVHHSGWSRGISMGVSAGSLVGRLLSEATSVLGPTGPARMMTGSRICAIENEEMAEDDGGCGGVPGTRSTAGVGAKSRARLRKTLGASGVAGSKWSMCSVRREALNIGWWRRCANPGRGGGRVDTWDLRVTTTREIRPIHDVRMRRQRKWEYYPATRLSRRTTSQADVLEPRDRPLSHASVGR